METTYFLGFLISNLFCNSRFFTFDFEKATNAQKVVWLLNDTEVDLFLEKIKIVSKSSVI